MLLILLNIAWNFDIFCADRLRCIKIAAKWLIFYPIIFLHSRWGLNDISFLGDDILDFC